MNISHFLCVECHFTWKLQAIDSIFHEGILSGTFPISGTVILLKRKKPKLIFFGFLTETIGQKDEDFGFLRPQKD